jgi:hypothetical protein
MSTAHDATPDPIPSGAPDAPDDQQVRRLLAEADGRSRSLPAAIPAAFITYGMLCVIGTFAVLGLRLAVLVPESADFDPRLLMILFSLAWVAVAMIPLWIFRDRWRRGLGRRWIVLMMCWAVLWAAGMILATTPFALIVAPLFFVLFVIAVTGEAAALRTRNRKGAERGEVQAR